MSYRAAAIGLVVLGVALATIGSGSYSSASADRQAAIEIAADDAAYLGFDGCTVANRATQPLAVTFDANNDTQQVELAPGETASIGVSKETNVTADGADIDIETVRIFDCGATESDE